MIILGFTPRFDILKKLDNLCGVELSVDRWLSDFPKPFLWVPDHNVICLHYFPWEFHTVYFDIYLPLLTSPRSFPTFLPTQLQSLSPLPFLFPSPTPLPSMSLVYAGQLFLGMGPSLECSWCTRYHSTEENRLFFSQEQSGTTGSHS